jgi:hypothetical protein
MLFQSVKNHPIGQRPADGYINATALCKACGKKVSHWLCLDTTTAYIDALAADAGIPASEIVQIRKGGNPYEQGTWVHPYAAINLAQWCSPEFALAVSKWVVGWMSEGRSPQPSQPPRELRSSDDLPPDVRRRNQAELYWLDQPGSRTWEDVQTVRRLLSAGLFDGGER